MLSYYTNDIDNPWTSKDVENYEIYGSQRDKIIYNSAYNSRLKLTDDNVYLYSVKQGSQYKNFYILGKTRSVFYLLFFVPQCSFLNDSECVNNQFVQNCISKLPLLKGAASSINSTFEVNNCVSIVDATCFFIKVNANIGELLFPRHKKITNVEILQKISLMNKVYERCIAERDRLIRAIDKFLAAQKEKREKLKSKITRMVIRKGLFYGVPMLLGIPPLGALDDLDSLFNLGDMANVADVVDMVDVADLMDVIDMPIGIDDLLNIEDSFV